MRYVIVSTILAVLAAGSARAACTDSVAALAARQAIAAQCPCRTATSHAQFVDCAASVTDDRISHGMLPASCRSGVVFCANKSICGTPNRVTCCIPRRDGRIRCKLKRSAQACADRGGTVTGTNATGCTSCCDACPAGRTGPSCGPS